MYELDVRVEKHEYAFCVKISDIQSNMMETTN